MGGLPDPWTLKSLDMKNLDPPNPGFLPTNLIPFPATLGTTQLDLDASKFPTNPAPHRRKFIIFDHSGKLTTFIFSSMQPPIQNSNPKDTSFIPKVTNLDGPSSTSMVNQLSIRKEAAANEETPCREEDADEIDVLLYSDSEDNGDVQRSTGQLPLITTLTEEEVSSSGGHTNRKRFNDEEGSDTTLVDTASSACSEDDMLSCIKGPTRWFDGEDRDTPVRSSGSMTKRVKRDRIHEAVCVLRGVIPGCKGETDAVVVLDEAIRYLKSLELKAKALGIAL